MTDVVLKMTDIAGHEAEQHRQQQLVPEPEPAAGGGWAGSWSV